MVTFGSRGKPLCSRKWPREEVQPTLRMVCIAKTRREECGMVWWMELALRKGNVHQRTFCGVLHSLILMTI